MLRSGSVEWRGENEDTGASYGRGDFGKADMGAGGGNPPTSVPHCFGFDMENSMSQKPLHPRKLVGCIHSREDSRWDREKPRAVRVSVSRWGPLRRSGCMNMGAASLYLVGLLSPVTQIHSGSCDSSGNVCS